jgi:hypothetical protein
MRLAITMQESWGASKVIFFVLIFSSFFIQKIYFFSCLSVFYYLFKKLSLLFTNSIDGDVTDRNGFYVEKEYHVITSPFVLTWTC